MLLSATSRAKISMNYHITRHENFSLATLPAPSYGVAMANITIDLHTDNNNLDQAIFALYPELLISGTNKYPRDEFLHAINMLGASIKTTIDEGRLTISLKSQADKFSKALLLLEQMMIEPSFKTADIKRVAEVTTAKLKIDQEHSFAVAKTNLRNELYASEDRRHAATYTKLIKLFNTIDTKTLRRFHQRALSTYWTCTIVGAEAEINRFTKLISKTRKSHALASVVVQKHKQQKPNAQVILKDIPSKSNIDFSIGTPIPITLHHPDYTALSFAIGVLGITGFAGRLMSTVRDKEGLTYTIYGVTESFLNNEQGYLRIFTFFTPEKSEQGLRSTFREIKKFYDHGISPKEFDTFQRIFTTRQTLLQDSLLKQVSELHAFNINGFTVDEITTFKDKIKSINRKEVNDVIKKYFDPEQFTISGAGPVDSVKKALQEFSRVHTPKSK